MARNIFVNLPVKDLPKSKAFFESVGFSFNAQFSDDTAACMVMSDTIYAMLLTHPKSGAFGEVLGVEDGGAARIMRDLAAAVALARSI